MHDAVSEVPSGYTPDNESCQYPECPPSWNGKVRTGFSVHRWLGTLLPLNDNLNPGANRTKHADKERNKRHRKSIALICIINQHNLEPLPPLVVGQLTHYPTPVV